MRVWAHIYSYNEQDIIGWSVSHLITQGCHVTVKDNWSTDDTRNEVRKIKDKRYPVELGFWPPNDPGTDWSLGDQLRDLDLWASQRPGDWIIFCDADEIRRTGSEDDDLVSDIARLDSQGYNVIDHVVQTYGPREGWDGSQNPEEFFTQRVDSLADRMPHMKCWKQPPNLQGWDRLGSGGHRIKFPGMKVAPERFVIKHYPLRSAAHAARKIAERRTRYAAKDLQQGWHRQYDLWTP